ncbi:MAG: hypothetical protein IJ727_03175 [Treponema sp.]|nr:hypothetical protein [Treponema sp.]
MREFCVYFEYYTESDLELYPWEDHEFCEAETAEQAIEKVLAENECINIIKAWVE